MFDYRHFKTVAYKHKYETAIEYRKSRVLYSELLEKVNAVYNSFCQMMTEGTLIVLSRDTEQTVCVSYAASRAGLCTLHADPKLPLVRLEELVAKYRPQFALLPSCEAERVGAVLAKGGCKYAVLTGERIQTDVFPSVFYYDELVKMNDYAFVRPDAERCPEHFFEDGFVSVPPDLSSLGIRDGIFIGMPVFTSGALTALDGVLGSGHKCVVMTDINPKAFSKQKVRAVITCDPAAFRSFSCDIIPLPLRDGVQVVTGGLFDSAYISEKLTRLCSREINCVLLKDRITATVTLAAQDDAAAIQGSPVALALKSAATDLLYPFDMPKTFVFKQK